MSQETFAPTITSLNNGRVKHARSLAQKKFRQQSGEFLAEGETLLRLALKSGFVPAQVFLMEKRVNALDDLIKTGLLHNHQIIVTTEEVQASLSGKSNPQPVVTIFRQPSRSLDDYEIGEKSVWIALQEPRDPGNLGTIIRTADAAGADGIILLGHGCDAYAPEVVRASMGSLLALPVISATLADFIAWQMASRDHQCLGLALEGSTDYHQTQYRAPLILMMGNEQTGLPEDYRRACDALVRIPMPGRAESLNLAVSTAIVLYHAMESMGRLDGLTDKTSPLAFS